MSSASKGSGAEFLVRKSQLSKSRKDLPALCDILVVEDKEKDAERLAATLRTIFGYDLRVRHVNTLSKALDEVLSKKPQVILLDDYLTLENATESIPMLRHTGYVGPIVIISGKVDRIRRAQLLGKGADDTINKDDLNSAEIVEVMSRLLGAAPAHAEGESETPA